MLITDGDLVGGVMDEDHDRVATDLIAAHCNPCVWIPLSGRMPGLDPLMRDYEAHLID